MYNLFVSFLSIFQVNTPIIITSGHVSDDMWDELEALGAAGRVVSCMFLMICVCSSETPPLIKSTTTG